MVSPGAGLSLSASVPTSGIAGIGPLTKPLQGPAVLGGPWTRDTKIPSKPVGSDAGDIASAVSAATGPRPASLMPTSRCAENDSLAKPIEGPAVLSEPLMQNAPNPIDPAEMGLEGSPVTGKQAASRPVCKAILVQHCPVYGFYDVKPKPLPAVQMLSPTNPYSLVFDLSYEENALLSSVGGSVEKAIRRHGELPTADLKKFWELQCLLNKLSTTPLGTSVNNDKVTTLVDEEGNKLYVINMPENHPPLATWHWPHEAHCPLPAKSTRTDPFVRGRGA